MLPSSNQEKLRYARRPQWCSNPSHFQSHSVCHIFFTIARNKWLQIPIVYHKVNNFFFPIKSHKYNRTEERKKIFSSESTKKIVDDGHKSSMKLDSLYFYGISNGGLWCSDYYPRYERSIQHEPLLILIHSSSRKCVKDNHFWFSALHECLICPNWEYTTCDERKCDKKKLSNSLTMTIKLYKCFA